VKKKVDDFEEVPNPEIVKENGEYKIIEKTPLTDVQIELQKDDPIIPLPKDLSCPEKKVTKEEKIEELCCHGEAMGNFIDAFEGKLVEGDLSLKAKVLREREKYNEKIPFKEKRDKIEKHFKTNVELILENGRIMSAADRGEKDAIDRYCHPELKYEMEPYEWTLVKLPNGKTQAVVVRGLEEESAWSTEEQKF
jgi:hypothetical protein